MNKKCLASLQMNISNSYCEKRMRNLRLQSAQLIQ